MVFLGGFNFSETSNYARAQYRRGLNGQKVEAIGPKILSGLSPTFMPNGRLAFASKIYGRWMIVSTKSDGSDLEYVSDSRINYFAPRFHPVTSQLLCYGPGPTTEQNFLNEFPAGIIDGKRYADKPLGNGPFLMEKGNKQIGDMKVGLYYVRGYFPILSKDTTRVASVAEFAKLVVSDLYGTEPKFIFKAPWVAIMGMDWSENLKKFVAAAGMPFASPSTKNDIWIFDEDGRNAKNITEHISGNNAFPRFMPNGKKVIFRSATTGYKNIYSITPDGKNLKQLTFNKKGTDTMPAVSPDGKQIAFSSLRKGQNYNLYLLRLMANGKPGKLRQLTNSKSLDVHPIFSPDGKWLAFVSGRDGFLDEWPLIRVFSPQPFGEIYAIRIEDGKTIRLTESKWEASVPDWK